MAMTPSRDASRDQGHDRRSRAPHGGVAPLLPGVSELSKSDVARRLFEAFNRRDVETGLELITEDVEFIAPTAEIANEGRPYLGHAGMRKYYEDVARVWEQLEVTPSEIREVDDAILALGRVYGRGEGGYIQDSPAQWVLRFRGDRAAYIRVFTNRSAAFAEVGLKEPFV
jgi:ketosteroid isomerase-like protein